MGEGMTCYERDEAFCKDQKCLRVGCRIRNERLSAESKMPARIWADDSNLDYMRHPSWGPHAYIRADLVEPLVAALRKCALVCAGETTTKHGLVDALESARAALQAYEAGQSGQVQTEARRD